jgi:hypothetical protein
MRFAARSHHPTLEQPGFREVVQSVSGSVSTISEIVARYVRDGRADARVG